jgi:hypothetical protein
MSNKFELLPSNYTTMKPIKFNGDRPLSDKRTIKAPFSNESCFFMIVVGKPKSGKTTFVFNTLTNKEIYKKIFKNIIYVAPITSRNNIHNNPLQDLDSEQLFDNLSIDVQRRVEENKKLYDETPEKHYNQLLLIDDCTAFLKDKGNVQMLNELAMNRRQISLSIILLTQYVVSIPPALRSQYNSIVIFKPIKKDYDRINKEIMFMKKDEFIDFIDYVFKVRHDNLFVNVDNENDYYKNLQKIIINR